MDRFIRENSRLILSTLFVIGSIMFAGYNILYTQNEARIKGIREINTLLVSEQKTLTQLVARAKQSSQIKGDKGQVVPVTDVTVFLKKINTIAHVNDVIIRKLSPDREKENSFKIEFIDDYYTFLRFVSMLEAMDILLGDIHVRPYDMGKVPPLHFITFSVVPRRDVKELQGQRLEELKKRVAEKNRRNPFQRFAFSNKKEFRPRIDLTWMYKLTAIGTSKGEKYATIDHHTYQVGDWLDGEKGKKITSIATDRLYLQQKGEEGLREFVLKFRGTFKDKK